MRLRIPAIAVDAAVEQVGLTAEGYLDTPRRLDTVGWFDLGPRPGDPGNAAIDGFVGIPMRPAIFWNLCTLTPGDELVVIGGDGVARRFVVTSVESYPKEEAPLRRIFGPANSAHLNLITDDPRTAYDPMTGNYASSLVVYADAAP